MLPEHLERGLTEETVQPDLTPEQRQLLDRYVDAFWRKDVDTIVSMLTAEAVWEMPPFTGWFRGPAKIGWLIAASLMRRLCTSCGSSVRCTPWKRPILV